MQAQQTLNRRIKININDLARCLLASSPQPVPIKEGACC